MELHQFKMNENEFGRYFFGMTSNILLEPDKELTEGDIIQLTETTTIEEKETGRNITFRAIEIDRNHGVIDEQLIWNVELRRLKNYKDVYKEQMKGGMNPV